MNAIEAGEFLNESIGCMSDRELRIWQHAKNYYNGLITEQDFGFQVINEFVKELEAYSVCG